MFILSNQLIPLLGIYLKEIMRNAHKYFYAWIFNIAIFVILKKMNTT